MRGIICIILFVLSVASFFMSGLFFINSGFVSLDGNGIDNRQSIELIAELDKLPLVYVNPYEINFCKSGKIIEINEKDFSFAPVYGEQERFSYDINLSEINTENRAIVCYNYLPMEGKKAFYVKNVAPKID
jgi:hypothetical protein